MHAQGPSAIVLFTTHGYRSPASLPYRHRTRSSPSHQDTESRTVPPEIVARVYTQQVASQVTATATTTRTQTTTSTPTPQQRIIGVAAGTDTPTATTTRTPSLTPSPTSTFTATPILNTASNLVLHLEAGNTSSYNGTGTTWTDLSGNGKNGTLVNGPTYTAGARARFNFDGTNDYVSVPAGFNNLTVGMTLVFVANLNNASSWERLMDFGTGTGCDNIIFARNSTSNTLNMSVYNGCSIVIDVNTTNGVLNNTTAVYAATVDGSNVRIYRDGVLINTVASTARPNNTIRTLNYIGRSNWSNDTYFESSISAVMIYNTALTGAQIWDNYVNLSTRYINNSPVAIDGALPAILEDASVASITGESVANLTNGVSDADAGALKGMAIVDGDYTRGLWEYTTNGGTSWFPIMAPSNSNAFLLAANGTTNRIRFRPDRNYNGRATLTYRAWDQTTGTSGSAVAIATSGVASAFSGNTGTITANIDPVDDAPTLLIGRPANGTMTYVRGMGSFGTGNGQIQYPYYADIDSAGNIYVGDVGNQRIMVFDANGAYLTKWGVSGSGNGQFNYPEGIAIDNADTVYVADYSNNRIQMFTTNGTYLGQFGTAGTATNQFNNPREIAFDTAGYMWITDVANNRIQRFDRAGRYVSTLAASGTAIGQITTPWQVFVDNDNNIYYSDDNMHRVQKFTQTSSTTWASAWGRGGSAVSTDGAFNRPLGVGTDIFGYVWVADFNNHRVQKLDPNTGAYITKIGGTASSTAGQFNQPIAVLDDMSGFVYIVEHTGSRVQKFDTTATSASQNEDTALILPFALTDGDVLFQTAVVTATSSSPSIATVAVNYTSGRNGTITVTPLANMYGATTITVTYIDSEGTSTSKAVTVTFTAVNDAPVASDVTLTTISEDVALASNTGTSVSALVANNTDVDIGAVKGLALVGADKSNGMWEFSTNGG
ncbi:MAG: LamG-like jellyroll fold domain-containing protein, partial [Roseiflexaceae bacterium]